MNLKKKEKEQAAPEKNLEPAAAAGKPAKKNIFKSRKFKYGGIATVITILFIVVVIVINMITVSYTHLNHEGIRVSFGKDEGDGWFLLRLSVHDPIMPLNIESDAVGGVKLIAGKLYDYVKTCLLYTSRCV